MAKWNWVNIGSGNGLLPDGTMPSPEPMLTHHWVAMTFTCGQFHERCFNRPLLDFSLKDADLKLIIAHEMLSSIGVENGIMWNRMACGFPCAYECLWVPIRRNNCIPDDFQLVHLWNLSLHKGDMRAQLGVMFGAIAVLKIQHPGRDIQHFTCSCAYKNDICMITGSAHVLHTEIQCFEE